MLAAEEGAPDDEDGDDPRGNGNAEAGAAVDVREGDHRARWIRSDPAQAIDARSRGGRPGRRRRGRPPRQWECRGGGGRGRAGGGSSGPLDPIGTSTGDRCSQPRRAPRTTKTGTTPEAMGMPRRGRPWTCGRGIIGPAGSVVARPDAHGKG